MKWYSKNKIYFRRIHILLNTLGFDLKKTYYLILNFFKYLNDLLNFKKKGGQIKNIYPFFENFGINASEFKNQFFHADLLIAQKIYNKNPESHIDIGSRIDGLVAHIASFRNLDFADIRNVDIKPHKNINVIKINMGDIDLKIEKKYFSVSSIGVIGHIGLGRYGDQIDPDGYLKAIRNICNLCENSGSIYIMVPVGKAGVEFNSHRVFNPHEIIKNFKINNCELIEFSLVDDFGELHINCDLNDAINLNFGGGIFIFNKK